MSFAVHGIEARHEEEVTAKRRGLIVARDMEGSF